MWHRKFKSFRRGTVESCRSLRSNLKENPTQTSNEAYEQRDFVKDRTLTAADANIFDYLLCRLATLQPIDILFQHALILWQDLILFW